MNDKEYRKLAFFTFPMLEHLLDNLYTIIQDLDNSTYDNRIVRTEVKRGKKTVTQISVTPLSHSQLQDYLKSKGYIPTIKAVIPILEQLTNNAWTLEQVSEFIHSQPEKLQDNYWLLYKFENCNFDNKDNRSIYSKLESCKYAIQHCYSFMSGTGIMDKVNAMFGYVAMQVKKNLDWSFKNELKAEIENLTKLLEPIEKEINRLEQENCNEHS